MDLGLNGRKVLITGGTRGIGRAMAQAFGAEGAQLALCARNERQVTETVKALRDDGVTAHGTALDIADHAALKSWIQRTGEELGGIDVVIANPSAFGIGATEADWQNGYAVDLLGTVHTVEAAMPFLEQSAQRSGDAAILILATAAIAETDFESAYGAYKSALVHYAKGAARRLAKQRVRVNTISPGTIYVEDGFWGNAKRNLPGLYADFFARNPMGRMGEPREVANVAAFLCSPAASFVTGANVFVDGGWTSRVNF
ncbi:MAG TPA: SDR family oxidoreductase [Acidiferrobacterales bacterium]